MLSKILSWAEKEEAIRALVLVGSRAIEGKHDKLSDHDISVFSRNSTPYTSSDSWLTAIGTPWVCVHEKLAWKSTTIPTRLVIFDHGAKVDFAFYPMEALTALAKEPLPEGYAAGYRILLDKDGLAQALPEPTFDAFKQKPPDEEEFHRIVEEFWFEAYHIANYLSRGDLWSAKLRDSGIKQEFLLPMIRWHEQSKNQWNYATHSEGKRMHEWVEAETWNSLKNCFSSFDVDDSWKALWETTSLFRRLAIATAKNLGYSYPHDVDKNISSYMRSIQRGR